MSETQRGGLHLATSAKLRAFLLCLLYFAQGFPWGFAAVALLSSLVEAGHPKEEAATLTALAILPWTFKFFWAPMIDWLRLPSLGIRRPWIAFAQLGMAGTLFAVWSTGDLAEDATLSFLAWVFFVHNCFASLQDVATDALAVDLLDDAERGRVNGFMWGSKLFGVAVGGAGMGKVIAGWGLETAVLVQALGIVGILALVLVVRERAGEKLFPWSSRTGQAPAPARASLPSFLDVLRELFRALSMRTAWLAVIMACTVNLCEGLWVPLTTELFVSEFGMSAEEFSGNQGTWGVLGELIGALLGGVLCDRLGRRRMAALGMILTSATLLTFALTSAYWLQDWYPAVLLLPMFKGCFAFATVSLFSLFMKIAWTNAAACQFTLYMAMMNVGHASGARLNSLNAWFPDLNLVHWQFYVLAGVLALVPLTMLPFLRPETIVARKLTEAGPVVGAPTSSAPEG